MVLEWQGNFQIQTSFDYQRLLRHIIYKVLKQQKERKTIYKVHKLPNWSSLLSANILFKT